MEFGLLLLRVVIGALFVGHGTQKLLGWFDGPGIDGTQGMLRSLGYRRPRNLAIVAGATETVAGALLVLGLLTPLAAAAVIGVMINAILTVHLPNGLWASDGGYEYNLVLIAGAGALAFAGPGLASLDGTLLPEFAGAGGGLIAFLLGVVVAGGILSMRASPEEVEAEEQERVEARSGV